MGFGLHAGKLVQGEIGAKRTLDATYVPETVESNDDIEVWNSEYKTMNLDPIWFPKNI